MYHMNHCRLLSPILLFVFTVEVVFVGISMSFNGIIHQATGEADWTLTRQAILSLRSTAARPDRYTRQHIASLGCAASRRGCRGGRRKTKLQPTQYLIPVVIGTGNRGRNDMDYPRTNQRRRTLSSIKRHNAAPTCDVDQANKDKVPSMYVLNAAALTKPHAVQQLAADLASYESDIAVITETHFKSKHDDATLSIPGYTLSRRDRQRRRGGGVAVYTRCILQPTVWTHSADDLTYELLWVRAAGVFIGALYHPPRAQYSTQSLLNYIEACLDELTHQEPTATIVLAGDFNQLTDDEMIGRTGLQQIVHQPTRGPKVLDRIFLSAPVYRTVRVVTSLMRSDHKAVIAYADQPPVTLKTSVEKTFRPASPTQHAAFLRFMQDSNFFDNYDIDETDTQSDFNNFYQKAYQLLEHFYPTKTVTISSRDPAYITPAIKAKLRRKNKLMRAGRTEKADALAQRIGKDIANRNKVRLSRLNSKTCCKDMWAAVREVTGRKQNTTTAKGVTADTLNQHYAQISSDIDYQQPEYRLTAACEDMDAVSEWRVFKLLDALPATATGLDLLPSWFLRKGAPFFYKPLTKLFRKCILTSTVPHQWKKAWIKPVPKIATPHQNSDYRPISITPVLSRMLERIIVRTFLYPALTSPPAPLVFADQYAFRPTGSTTAALVAMLHSITDMLSTSSYVIVLALDFSKAFDTVRHYTLLQKIGLLDIPDSVYNWFVNFFSERRHSTRYGGDISTMLEINASIIQGSALGPVSYVVNAGDLNTVTPGNRIHKYADDTYILVPASNTQSRIAELDHVEEWAQINNLKLNRAKSTEIVITGKRKHQDCNPSHLPGIKRVTAITILGLTITNHLSVSEHVTNIVSKCAQSLYAIKVLRCQGMSEDILAVVFKSVVLAKILYASPAWWGFANSSDKQRLEAFLRRCIRLHLYRQCDPTVTQLVEDMEDKLFTSVLHNDQHVLFHLLPEHNNCTYNLRPRRHELVLAIKGDARNFIERQLFKDTY